MAHEQGGTTVPPFLYSPATVRYGLVCTQRKMTSLNH